MIQTLTQNSVLSQNWVGCTPKEPRLRAHCAQAAHWAPCLGSPPSMSQCALAVSRAVPRAVSSLLGHNTKKLYRNSILVVRAAVRVVVLLRRVVGRCCAVSQPLARCVATPGLPLLSRYNRLFLKTSYRVSVNILDYPPGRIAG